MKPAVAVACPLNSESPGPVQPGLSISGERDYSDDEPTNEKEHDGWRVMRQG